MFTVTKASIHGFNERVTQHKIVYKGGYSGAIVVYNNLVAKEKLHEFTQLKFLFIILKISK